ncbi:UNVERIFIED_CONTAM: hypothetical protein Sradi_3620000 [Sesamum radiatum]|uniref:Uncharacterized protein n=1 Tax=Sesamum radiatum TaxID=300843 RepID=A0AAW2QHZ6_SESRA
MVLPSLSGTTPGMRGPLILHFPLDRAAHDYTRFGSLVHGYHTRGMALASYSGYGEDTFFPWPVRDWPAAVQWAARGWRGKHMVNASFRALLASLVYHLWHERNRRIFQHTSRTADSIARIVVSDIRELIICKQLPRTISSRGLYRLWRIPWPVEGDAST